MGDIGVGLIGYGLAGRSFHAPFIEAVTGLRLAAIVTTDPSRRALAASEHPASILVGTFDALLERPDIGLVVVAAPNSLHAPLAMRALDTGRHVVLDKPIALSVAEGEGLLEAAARSKGLLTVYQNRRWDGDALTVQRLVGDGALGPLDAIESRFERWEAVGPGWRDAAAEAGGPLRDLGAHLVDQVLRLAGPAHRVWAQLDRRRPGTAVDDAAFVAIDHATGIRSRLWMSLIASRVGPRIRVRGLAGEYVKWDLDVQEAQLVGGMPPDAPGFGEDPPERWGTVHRADGTSERVPTAPGRYTAFYELMRDAIVAGGQPPVDPADSLQVLRLLEAAERAAASGSGQIVG
jgi:predicted dehydrogenase